MLIARSSDARSLTLNQHPPNGEVVISNNSRRAGHRTPSGKMTQQLTSLRGNRRAKRNRVGSRGFVRHFSNGNALGSYAGLTFTSL
jgi:hypothetical protein